jgi:hypothetical protein
MLVLGYATAFACGGFFCANQEIDQSAERIVFTEDPETGDLETHVQVFYDGPSEDFAWVIPAPVVPEVFLSTDEMFDDIADLYRPLFRRRTEEVGTCDHGLSYGYYGGGMNGGGGGYASTSAGTAPVQVVATSDVGPYETVTLKADSSEALEQWLLDSGLSLPEGIADKLAPYVASDHYFVAMRMGKNESTGSIQPVGLRYPASGMSVPIQLTSIAALPDTRLEVYVLGEHRAVPDSYLHVRINPAAIDWFGGDNYDSVVTRAADEAGSHAFATDYSGPPMRLNDRAYKESTYDMEALRNARNPVALIEAVGLQFDGTDQLLAILEEFVPPPPGVDPTDFYNAPRSYELPDDYTYDVEGLIEALEERIVEPLLHVAELFDYHPHITRLTSSLDASEMTVDPTFVFNADMEQTVDHEWWATERFLCGNGIEIEHAFRELVLPDGRVIDLPSVAWLGARGMTELEYMEALASRAAISVERTSSEGEPTIIADYSEEQEAAATTLTTDDGSAAEAEGCGCQASGAAGVPWLLGLLVVARRRR